MNQFANYDQINHQQLENAKLLMQVGNLNPNLLNINKANMNLGLY